MMQVFRRSTLITVVLLGMLGYLLLCTYMWATQEQQIFEPTPILQSNPERMGMEYKEFKIPSGSGEQRGELDSWWIPAAHSDSVTLLYLHGNDRNISSNLTHVQRLHDLGYNVLMVDYRGFGESTGGSPNEKKVYEDAESAWQFAIKEGKLKPNKIFIYGHSLGGAIGIDLAVHHPDAGGLIAESTFTSMQAMGELRYGYLPVASLLNQRFDSLQKIPQLKIPVLFIHGTWDKEVPYEMSQQLYAAAPPPKFITLIQGGSHNNSGAIGWVEYRDALSGFIEKYQR
ncbi:MAG: alpha/beta fold hydrolase [Gallionella sp.]